MAVPAPIHSAVSSRLAEATYLLLPHDLGVIASSAVPVLREHVAGYQALLVGPGLSHEVETASFVHTLLGLHPSQRKSRMGFVSSLLDTEPDQLSLPPLVIDADALNALSTVEQWWTALPAGTVLTPHPGEMARLMGAEATARDVQVDREGVCLRMAQAWGAVIVLKGAFTVVAAPDGRLMVIPYANAGLATAGSGDVLAGAIAGFRAQALGGFESAVAGAFVHGLAGELARAELGDMGMVAGDLPPLLPRALQRIRQSA
jgi:NAD(P)H-hydrate epimerase